MLIDWFTVVAQVGNFLILVWLLKRFLYKPIVDAIDAREKRIRAEVADADVKRVEVQKSQETFAQKNRAFDDERAALFIKASTEAKAEATRLLDQVRQESVDARALQEKGLREDQRKIGDQITRLAAAEVFEIARKTLAELATVSLEERVSEVFNRRLHELSGKAKDDLNAALKASSEPAVVSSSFELPPAEKAAIQNALNECFSAEISVRFITGGAGICGIELTVHGQKLAWNIKSYLAELAGKVETLLQKQSNANADEPTGTDTSIKAVLSAEVYAIAK